MAQPNGGYIYGPPPAPPPKPITNTASTQHNNAFQSHGRGSWRGDSGRGGGFGLRGNNQHRGRGGMGPRGRGGSFPNQQPNFYHSPQQSHTSYNAPSPYYPQSGQQWSQPMQAGLSQPVSFFPHMQPQNYNPQYMQASSQSYQTQSPQLTQTTTYAVPQLIPHAIPRPTQIPGLPQRPQRSYDDLSVEGRVRPPAAPSVPSFLPQHKPLNPPIPLADFRQSVHPGRGGQRGFGRGRGRGHSHGGHQAQDRRLKEPITKDGEQEYDLSPEELAVFRATGGKIKGTNLTLNDPAELEAWKEERRKKFPTRAKIDAKLNKEREQQAKEQNDDLQRRLDSLTQTGTLLKKRKQEDETPIPISKNKRRRKSKKAATKTSQNTSTLIQEIDQDQVESSSPDDEDNEDKSSIDDSDIEEVVPKDVKIKEILATSGIEVTALQTLEANADIMLSSESDNDSVSESESNDEPEVASAKIPTIAISGPLSDIRRPAVCYSWINRRCNKKDCPYLHEGKQRMTKKEQKTENEKKRAEQDKSKKGITKKSLYQMLRENDMEKENVIILQAIRYLVEQVFVVAGVLVGFIS